MSAGVRGFNFPPDMINRSAPRTGLVGQGPVYCRGALGVPKIYSFSRDMGPDARG